MPKDKKINKKYFLVIIPIIVVIGLYFVFQNPPAANTKQRVLTDISNLLALSNSRPLTSADLQQLRSDVGNDSVALGYVDDAIWFANHNIQLHIGHNLSDLYNYYYYGKDEVCIPHEIEHLGDYIKYNDYSRISTGIDRINSGYADWYQNAATNKQKFPATYSNFDQLSVMINATLNNLKSGNYLPTLDNITYITQYDYEGCVIS